jgi:hypothetical protein
LSVIGWNTLINADMGRAGVSFYILVPALHRVAKLVDLTIRMVTEEQVFRAQRTKNRELEGRLHQTWARYFEDEITASQLLRECGGFYGPSRPVTRTILYIAVATSCNCIQCHVLYVSY